MKKVINGKMYNTETSEKVGVWDIQDYNSNIYSNDFRFFGESLYRKKTGEFFLYFFGYNLTSSPYHPAHQADGNPEVKILPISLNGAKKWVSDRLSGDDYENIFGSVEE